MSVALIVLAAFGGASVFAATLAVCILIGDNRLTLPGTNARRLARAQTELVISEIQIKREQNEMFRDDLIDKRVQHALTRGDE